ncbi:hypothetical protein PAPYR_2521 [Paratrimastix pyriformis]|uniref:Uncharacterized protein n=1 Tax=Paratrimastix pyriformis TaxID=342808 RepID=A0ABQ8URI6_9EUKA|nr:hypothetical protein PAPYR_2521 [Paratrimastix pyriformis]
MYDLSYLGMSGPLNFSTPPPTPPSATRSETIQQAPPSPTPPKSAQYPSQSTTCCCSCFYDDDARAPHNCCASGFYGVAQNSQLLSHWFPRPLTQLIRLIEVAFMICSVLISVIFWDGINLYFYTDLSYIVLIVYCIIQLTTHTRDGLDPPLTSEESQRVPHAPPGCHGWCHQPNIPTSTRLKWVYVIAEICFTNAFMATILFWVMVFPARNYQLVYQLFVSVSFHGINSAVALNELIFMTSFVFPLHHIWVVLLQGFIYAAAHTGRTKCSPSPMRPAGSGTSSSCSLSFSSSAPSAGCPTCETSLRGSAATRASTGTTSTKGQCRLLLRCGVPPPPSERCVGHRHQRREESPTQTQQASICR